MTFELSSRAKYQCPQELAEFIEKARMFPPDLKWPDKNSLGFKTARREDLADAALERFLNWTAQSGHKARQYFEDVVKSAEKQTQDRIEVWWRCLDHYEGIQSDIAFLRLLAKWATDESMMRIDLLRKLSTWRYFRHGDHRDYDSELKATVRISEAGYFKVTVSGLGNAIDNQPARLRICLVCDHVFWAQRKDKKTCDGKCADTNRQRRVRANKKKSQDLYKRASIKKANTQNSKRAK